MCLEADDDRTPFSDRHCITRLFQCLNLDNILHLFRRILLDTSNILEAKDQQKIAQCLEAIKILGAPFKYEHVHMSRVPATLIDRVDAPYIFLLGVSKAAKDGDKKQKSQEKNLLNNITKDGTYLIDLDGDSIGQIPHTSVILKRTGTNKVLASEDLPDLPHKWVKTLRKSIEDQVNKVQKKEEGPLQGRHPQGQGGLPGFLRRALALRAPKPERRPACKAIVQLN